MGSVLLITAIIIASWFLWTQRRKRRYYLDRLRGIGFQFDESFEMGDSDLMVDRTKRQIAFQNWSALLIQRNDFYYVPDSLRKYKTIGQIHAFEDVFAVFVEKENKETHRAIRFHVGGEFYQHRLEYTGSYLSLSAVVPAATLKKMLPRLQSIIENDFSKKVEFMDPLY